MIFAIAVHGAPYSNPSPVSAYHFARAVLHEGHGLYRVFFYHDGVYTANKNIAAPQDEMDIRKLWHDLAIEENIELIVCIASALRRGIVDQTEADRYDKSCANMDDAFTLSGLGQLIDASLNVDRLITFGQ